MKKILVLLLTFALGANAFWNNNTPWNNNAAVAPVAPKVAAK